MYVFVQLSHDYSDEFNVDCCYVDTEAQCEADLNKVKAGFDADLFADVEFYFGTNEALLFHRFSTFDHGVTVQVCSKQFYKEFKALTAGSGCTGYNVVENMLELLDRVAGDK